ncbi:hypothetical protein [Asanoa sp. NPDC050611]|uniref:hypothetical protein n=1 Tax=Asanoa sp. NPDC050611 TaxID=3157098 RepID=UPI0033ED4F7A
MDANDVIDSYVHDVARRLPGAKRDDVAFELRALLREDLRSRAASTGRPADAELATEMLRAFGRPGDTAGRYHRPFTLIAPGDTWSFIVAALAGGSVLSLLFYPTAEQTFPEAGTRSSVAVLAWFGLLLVGFTTRSVILRYRPDAFAWKPRPVRARSDRAGWPGAVAYTVFWLVFLLCYLVPQPLLTALTFGRFRAEELEFSGSFLSWLRIPWLAVMVVLLIALHLWVAHEGHWRRLTRWARIVLILEVAIQLGWHSRYGDVFQVHETNRLLLPWFAIVSAVLVIWTGVLAYRELSRVDPAPRLVAHGPSGPNTP